MKEEIDDKKREELEKKIEDIKNGVEKVKEISPEMKELNEKLKETDWDFECIQEGINKKLEKELKDNIDSYYIPYKTYDDIDTDALKSVVEGIEFDIDDKTELELKVTRAKAGLNGEKNHTIYIYLKWGIMEGFKRKKNWRYDINDVIRWKKLGFLFE